MICYLKIDSRAMVKLQNMGDLLRFFLIVIAIHERDDGYRDTLQNEVILDLWRELLAHDFTNEVSEYGDWAGVSI